MNRPLAPARVQYLSGVGTGSRLSAEIDFQTDIVLGNCIAVVIKCPGRCEKRQLVSARKISSNLRSAPSRSSPCSNRARRFGDSGDGRGRAAVRVRCAYLELVEGAPTAARGISNTRSKCAA